MCPKVNVKKVNWKKVDSEKYQTLLADRLQRVEKSKDINERVGQITDIVTLTARECAPKMKQKPKNCKKFWCSELAKLSKDSKRAFGDWKKGGCPAEPHYKLDLVKTSAKKKLHNRQRQIHAENRSKMYKEITTTHTENKNLFYKLINRQRQTGREILNELVINGDHLTESDSIRQGWADYFKTLATPVENKNFDEEYKAHIELRKHLIQNVCENDKNKTEISTNDVQKVINSMKNSKAADKEGLTAEHFKYGGDSLVQTVTNVVEDIMNGNEIPKIFKEGLITPIYKKQGKPTYDPNSYRRITITSILGKITEKVHLNLVNNMLDEAQSKLQRGFTKDTSSTCGSLLLTEAIAESVDNGKPLYTAFIDASKAFDVVWHDSMLVKLYDVGLSGHKWNFLNKWYTGLESAVKWEGDVSQPFPERQGVRQGGIWSPTGYKHFVNPFMNCLTRHRVGLYIGSIYLGVVGVADDLLLMADMPEELQCALNIQWSYACQERYQISDTKTKTMQHNVKNQTDEIFLLNETQLESVHSYKHLGLIRESNNKLSNNLLIEDRIKKARNTAYALMGAGFHGLNGINTEVSVCIWQTYVRPRLVYGLESINLSNCDIKKMELYQRTLIRQILHLPERVASSAMYILSGQLPVEAEIHKRRLTLYGNIVRKECVEKDLARRQLAVKDSTSKSWFIALREILYKYGLPTAQELLDNPPEKLAWKIMVGRHVNEHWKKEITQEAETKSTLKFLNKALYAPGKVHPIWTQCKHNSNSLLKAYAQVKLTCGSYVLQSVRAKFNQFQVSKLCPLCREEDETMQHFILHCSELESTRASFISALCDLVVCEDNEELLGLILDPSTACTLEENSDSGETQIFSLA